MPLKYQPQRRNLLRRKREHRQRSKLKAKVKKFNFVIYSTGEITQIVSSQATIFRFSNGDRELAIKEYSFTQNGYYWTNFSNETLTIKSPRYMRKRYPELFL